MQSQGYAEGKLSWVEWIESASGSADRFGDRDVVPLSLAKQLAARLDQCYTDRKERHCKTDNTPFKSE